MGEGFRDLEVWREAKALAVDVYRMTDSIRDVSLRDQIRRAAVSVPSNIAEGDERSSDRDSVRCFYIAKGSLGELRTQIEIAADIGLIAITATQPLLVRARELGHRLGALIKHRSPS